MRGAQWGLRRKPTAVGFCYLLMYLCGMGEGEGEVGVWRGGCVWRGGGGGGRCVEGRGEVYVPH